MERVTEAFKPDDLVELKDRTWRRQGGYTLLQWEEVMDRTPSQPFPYRNKPIGLNPYLLTKVEDAEVTTLKRQVQERDNSIELIISQNAKLQKEAEGLKLQLKEYALMEDDLDSLRNDKRDLERRLKETQAKVPADPRHKLLGKTVRHRLGGQKWVVSGLRGDTEVRVSRPCGWGGTFDVHEINVIEPRKLPKVDGSTVANAAMGSGLFAVAVALVVGFLSIMPLPSMNPVGYDPITVSDPLPKTGRVWFNGESHYPGCLCKVSSGHACGR